MIIKFTGNQIEKVEQILMTAQAFMSCDGFSFIK